MIRRPSCELSIEATRVVKRFLLGPVAARAEAEWARRFPDIACPVLDVDGDTIVMPRLEVIGEDPTWRPYDELRDVLGRLHAAGVHHRDVSVANIARDADGRVRLIDWESACEWESERSYDLVGPVFSGVPKPAEDSFAMWWWAEHDYAPGRWWL